MEGITQKDYEWLLDQFNADPKKAMEAVEELFKDPNITIPQARFLGGIEGQLKQMIRDREAINAYITGSGSV